MSLVIPCIKGRMGNTDFYQATMTARELVSGVRPAKELDDWASMSIEDRMQRDPNMARIKEEIAPYLAENKDRFFGALIVLIYSGKVNFESLKDLGQKVPQAYRSGGEKLGFVTIDGGQLIVLDGQHRLLALEHVVKQDVTGPCVNDVPADDVCVIFISHEDSHKTRRIFNRVNRYAKPTSRGDNIITSEDDAFAIVARRLLSDSAPLAGKDADGESIVNWKSNTLSARSSKMTTISAVYETVRQILDFHGATGIDPKTRPKDEELEQYTAWAVEFWDTVLTGVEPYRQALANTKKIPQMREDAAKTALLFKPAAQIALFRGLVIAAGWGTELPHAVGRINGINWSMKEPMWRDVIVRGGGGIETRKEAVDHAARLIAYLVADKVPDDKLLELKKAYNAARGNPGGDEDLPSRAALRGLITAPGTAPGRGQ
jgi:DNA sulfur modification protein DndB